MKNATHTQQQSLYTPLFIILFLLSHSAAYSQKVPIKWNKISTDELAMMRYDKDTSAAAVVLADFGNLSFDLSNGDSRYRFEHHKRIKILKKSGFDYGNITIPFYHDEKVSMLKAQVITPDGTRTSVSNSDIFEEKTSKYWSRMVFTCPQLQEGAIIEYKYYLTSEHIGTLPEWYFQRDIPTLYSEIRLSIPEWYDYVFLNQGLVAKVEHEQSNTTLRLPNIKYSTQNKFASQTITKANMVSAKIDKYRYILEHVPAFKEEAYITTPDDHLARLRFQLKHIQFPNGRFYPYLTSWTKVAEELMDMPAFGKQITKKKNSKHIIEAIQPEIDKGATIEEKVLNAYYYLTNEMEWDGRYTITADENLNECFEQKKGSTGELNLMFLAVLHHLGVEYYPLLMSTRDHGRMIELYPVVEQFNHLVVAANINEQFHVFDLGNPVRPNGFPRINALNGKAWVVNPANPQWIDLVPPRSSSSQMVELSIGENGQVDFNMKGKYEGYDAIDLREHLIGDLEGRFIIKNWQQRFPEAEIGEITYDKKASPSDPLVINFTGSLNEIVQQVGDFMYITPNLMPLITENPFKLEERSYPVDIPFPFKSQRLIFIDIPKGYSIEELPESARFNLPNGGGKFEYLINKTSTQVSLIMKLEINQLLFKPEEYTTIKNFFEIILQKQGEQLVFVKKT